MNVSMKERKVNLCRISLKNQDTLISWVIFIRFEQFKTQPYSSSLASNQATYTAPLKSLNTNTTSNSNSTTVQPNNSPNGSTSVSKTPVGDKPTASTS